MFSAASLREESLEGVISKSLVRGHASIRLDSMLETVEFPTGISNLDSSLANVNRDTLTLKDNVITLKIFKEI